MNKLKRGKQIFKERGVTGLIQSALLRFRLTWGILRIRALIDSLGYKQAFSYLFQQTRQRVLRPGEPYPVFSKLAHHPLWCRPGASDILVFEQIFVQRQYEFLKHVDKADFILDCGANVGYASAYFLSRFPQARLTAIEPDPDNFSILERNLASYGERAKAICSAIWSHPTGLVMSEARFGDGREWARQVREPRENEDPVMIAWDIGSLINGSGFERVSILKIDIEGAEEVVFSALDVSWISRVDNLLIEIHGEKCRSIFMEAIAGEDFFVTEYSELFICSRSPIWGLPPDRGATQ